jgi:hypothetical protein
MVSHADMQGLSYILEATNDKDREERVKQMNESRKENKEYWAPNENSIVYVPIKNPIQCCNIM